MYKILPPQLALWPSVSLLPAPPPANSLQHTHSSYTPGLLGALNPGPLDLCSPVLMRSSTRSTRKGTPSPLWSRQRNTEERNLLLKILFLLPLIAYHLSLSLFFEGGCKSTVLSSEHLLPNSPLVLRMIYISPLRRLGSTPHCFTSFDLGYRLKPAEPVEKQLGPFTGEDKQVIFAPVLNDLTI